jgi:hypothetical protein
MQQQQKGNKSGRRAEGNLMTLRASQAQVDQKPSAKGQKEDQFN